MVFAALSMILVQSVSANGIDVFVNKDKVEYGPGDTGTISIIIRNTSEDPIEIRNMSIQFTNWMMYTVDGWDELGNRTIFYSPYLIVASNQSVALEDISFTVPSDGRAQSTDVELWVYTNKPSPLNPWPRAEYIYVVPSYQQNIQRSMNNIVLLLTVAAILAILSAIIIASAIFLSARRPNVKWQKEA